MGLRRKFFWSAAEKDKDTFQSKMVANSSAIDELNHTLHSLASKLKDAEDTVRRRKLSHLCFINPTSMMKLTQYFVTYSTSVSIQTTF